MWFILEIFKGKFYSKLLQFCYLTSDSFLGHRQQVKEYISEIFLFYFIVVKPHIFSIHSVYGIIHYISS